MTTDSIEIKGLEVGVKEIDYSEKIGPYPAAMPDSITFVGSIIVFTLGAVTSGFLSEVGKEIWTQIKKAYAQRRKKKLRRKIPTQQHITGRITFNCDGVEVVCDFDEFEDIHMDTLRVVIHYIAEKPNISDVLIPIQGPIQYKERGSEKIILWSTLKKMYPK